ncbi:MAG: beta-lactamase domain protein [Firmicutes bacterium]|nr:beta-lactamase domain protein [Bacillota bacterium]
MYAHHHYCIIIRDSLLADLQHINNIAGTGLIYSLWGGYLQTKRVQKFIQYAEDQHMNITHLHTSGHADSKKLHKIVQACTPCKIIPIHTEYPEHFINEFDNVRIVQDGEALLLNQRYLKD